MGASRKAEDKERQDWLRKYEEDRIKQAIEDMPKIEHRINNPEAPDHPDMGKESWVHSKTMTVTSGRICFGLRHEVQSGASEDVMTFEDALCIYGDRGYGSHSPHNTVAKNGTWRAYKLIDRNTAYDKYYPNRTDDDRVTGWFICHEDIEDPVADLCDIVYNTFDGENGGNYHHWSHILNGEYASNMSNDTHYFHMLLGYILIARYAIGYPVNILSTLTEEEQDAMYNEGLYVVD